MICSYCNGKNLFSYTARAYTHNFMSGDALREVKLHELPALACSDCGEITLTDASAIYLLNIEGVYLHSYTASSMCALVLICGAIFMSEALYGMAGAAFMTIIGVFMWFIVYFYSEK